MLPHDTFGARSARTSSNDRAAAGDPHGRDLPITEGARSIADRATFELLARSREIAGRRGALEMKFLVAGVGTDAPALYLVNTNAFAFHYDFATEALGMRLGLGEFVSGTYFRDDRSQLAGTIVEEDGGFAIEFWPTDRVGDEHAALALRLVTRAMPFAAGRLACRRPAAGRDAALLAA
ncbi:MAG TPA: hypothetical protein VHZ31_09725 [Solirubrobacteraceae bacterium]|jgi:hypothetical protein|nr:hypothetical protein [Solirubrobacteraceae bacterium]